MINFNGEIIESNSVITSDNRAFLYGDGVFETVKIANGKILFSEDHYFRLMAAMRIVRMEIPMDFTMEYFETQILALTEAENTKTAARARITVFRNDGGLYLPKNRNVSFVIAVSKLQNPMYESVADSYEIELYKDFYLSAQLLSTIKTTNRMIQVLGSIFAEENGYDNCLLLNESKNIVEALQGNIFMLSENKMVTPPLSEGCINGVMRRQILALAKKIDGIEVLEIPISPFDLQKADELFITNVVMGIRSVTKYRKKEYQADFANNLIGKLNASILIQ